jgi:pimeloyl-ACP methyl ester carboxylesterase
MPVIHHKTEAHGATYGAPKRAAALLATAPSTAHLALLWLRAALGAALGLSLGGLPLAALLLAMLFTPLLPLYLLAELLFAVYFFRRLAALSRVPERHEPANAAAEGEAAFERFVAAAATMPPGSVETLIARWCRALPGYGATATTSTMTRTSSAILEGVTRGNAADMLTYGFFYRSREQLPEGAGEAMVRRLEKAWGRAFAPGKANPALKLMAHLREPVRAHWRPLAFYLGTEVIALAKHCAMLAAGWKAGKTAAPDGGGGGATYYTYGDVTNSSTPPILFCHGVGLGLAPYVPLVQRLAATGRPMIAVEFKHLAMRWTERVPTVEDAATELASILKQLNVPRVDAIGHSFGTFFLARLLRTRPDLVRTIALLDPVCCCMWTGDLVSSFVYRPHASRTGRVTWLIARDLHAAAAVSRNFFWSDYELWPQDLEKLGKRALLAVGGRDDLVPAAHVAATLASSARVAMLHDETMAHADVVFKPRWQRRALDEALAQMAAADCEDLAQELMAERRAAAAVAAEACKAPPAVVAPATPALSPSPAANLAATIVRKAATAPARGCSVPAVCADGDEQPFLLPMQRSYTIAAGVSSPPSSPTPAQPRRNNNNSYHARSDSVSSVGTVADFAAGFLLGGVAEEEEEEDAEQQQAGRQMLLQSPFARCSADAWAAAASADEHLIAAAVPPCAA